jgi:hypothetical protein
VLVLSDTKNAIFIPSADLAEADAEGAAADAGAADVAAATDAAAAGAVDAAGVVVLHATSDPIITTTSTKTSNFFISYPPYFYTYMFASVKIWLSYP